MIKNVEWLQIKSYIFTVHESVSWTKTYLSKTPALCIALTVQQLIYYFDIHDLTMLGIAELGNLLRVINTADNI